MSERIIDTILKDVNPHLKALLAQAQPSKVVVRNGLRNSLAEEKNTDTRNYLRALTLADIVSEELAGTSWKWETTMTHEEFMEVAAKLQTILRAGKNQLPGDRE